MTGLVIDENGVIIHALDKAKAVENPAQMPELLRSN